MYGLGEIAIQSWQGQTENSTNEVESKFIWFLQFYISGLSTDPRKVVLFYVGTLLGMMLEKGEFGISK